MFFQALRLIAIISLPGLAPGILHAADIRVTDNPLCRISLSGPIVAGDSERLRRAVESLIRAGEWEGLDTNMSDSWSTEDWRLCLDSPGGSLEEAARMAEYMVEAGIGTVLAPGVSCLSSCAMVFMLGHANHYASPGSINRRMHYSARLGFHAPWLPLDGIEALSRAQAQGAIAALNQAVGVILRLSNTQIAGQPPAIPPDLLERAYAHGEPDSFFEIDSIAWAGRAAIPVFGFEWPSRIDAAAAIHACTNLWRWQFLMEADTADSDWEEFAFEGILRQAGQPPAAAGSDHIYVRSIDTGKYTRDCVINRDLRNGLMACGKDEFLSRALYRSDCNLPHYVDRDSEGSRRIAEAFLDPAPALAIFAPQMRLRELPEASRQISVRVAAEADNLSCVMRSAQAQVINVNEYVNLRREANFSAPVLRQVPLGERLHVVSNRSAQVTGRSCLEACEALGRPGAGMTMQAQARACIADHAVWVEVTDTRGNRGWISRHFLRDGG